uniref:G-protein coupled receptors family 1 profile domain-containing protein n=1 Tax=Anopheles culicifacies TaxID=139723 RepID=A0A182LSU4_9DIPT
MYAWLAVLVLPINSALNPVLYTLTTAQFKQQLARFCYTIPCGAHPEYDSAIDSRVHHQSKLSTGSTGMLRVPSSLPSSPSTIITNIEQDREERDIPIEMAALVVYDQNGVPNRFSGSGSSYSQGQGVHMGPTVNSGHRKHRSTAAVLMLMERCSNSSTETFDF